MRFDRFDLNLLVALDVLLEEKSVSAAARRLNLSQPAVTGALNRLRAYFDDELLVQEGRRMLLSAKAEELGAPVRRALMQIRCEITQSGDFNPANSRRRFTIVASDYAYTILLADVLAAAATQAPHISVEVKPPSAKTLEEFERAEIDLFLSVSAFTVQGHPHLALFRDEEVLICWKGAGYKTIDLEGFYAAGHAVASFGSDRQPSLADLHLGQIGRKRRIEVSLPNFGALPQAVAGTRRLATMHRLYAEHFARLYPIVLHPLPVPIPDIVEIVQWHRIRDKDPGVQWLLGLLRAEAAKLPTVSR